MLPLDPGQAVSLKVVLAKPDAKWAVAASADGRLFPVQVTAPVLWSWHTGVLALKRTLCCVRISEVEAAVQ